jgi:hypothetical protein
LHNQLITQARLFIARLPWLLQLNNRLLSRQHNPQRQLVNLRHLWKQHKPHSQQCIIRLLQPLMGVQK